MSLDARDARPVRTLVPLAVEDAPPPLGQQVHAFGGATMGTGWSLRLAAPRELRIDVIERAVTRVLDQVVQEMSHWERDSALSRFNRADAGSWHALPAGFAEVMAAALEIAQRSGGAFDPALGAQVRLAGFGPPPDAGDTAHLGPHDWRALELHDGRLLQPGGVQLDLSAIAKGHAVDLVAQALAAIGFEHQLVEIGGELRGHGFKPDGTPWWVDIEPPAAHSDLKPTRVALHGLAIASSGDYRRFRIEADGRRVSHTLDPRTQAPIAHGLAAVSVVHPSAMWADGWSTALMALGLDAGLALAREQGLAALFVQRAGGGFEAFTSPALDALAA